MKKHIILALIIISAFISNATAQNQYFYEFSVPGLTTKSDASNITKAINGLGIYNLRVSETSQKVLCFSDQNVPVAEFASKLNSSNYYIFFFNSGIQGVNQHINKTISQWNEINLTNSTEKVFVVFGEQSFSQNQKEAINTLLKTNLKVDEIKYSNDNKKLLVYSNSKITRKELKTALYSYNNYNKLTNLVEIYK